KLVVAAEERRHRGEDIGGRRTADRAQTGTAQGVSRGIHQKAAKDVLIHRDPPQTGSAICEPNRNFSSPPRRPERRAPVCVPRFLQGVDDGPGPGRWRPSVGAPCRCRGKSRQESCEPNPAIGKEEAMSFPSDAEVIRRSLGMPEAFGLIYDRHAATVLRFL